MRITFANISHVDTHLQIHSFLEKFLTSSIVKSRRRIFASQFNVGPFVWKIDSQALHTTHYLLQYSSRVFCLLPRTTAIICRVAERGGRGLTSFSTQTRGTPRFTTAIFHPSSWSWQPMKYPLLSHAVHRKSRWTLRFAKIAWTSVIYVLLLILSYIYILYFRFEEQTNKMSAY